MTVPATTPNILSNTPPNTNIVDADKLMGNFDPLYAAFPVQTDNLGDNQVTAAKIATGAIKASNIGLQSVGAVQVASLALNNIPTAVTGAGTQIIETNANYVDVIAASSSIKAVVTGVYQFSFFARIAVPAAPSYAQVEVWKNGAYLDAVASGNYTSSSKNYHVSRTLILSLTANDSIQMAGWAASGTAWIDNTISPSSIHAIYLGPAS